MTGASLWRAGPRVERADVNPPSRPAADPNPWRDCRLGKERSTRRGRSLPLLDPALHGTGFLRGRTGSPGLRPVAVSTILRDLALVALILFLMARDGEPVAALGWTVRRVMPEVGLGAVLLFPLFLGAQALERALHSARLSAPSTPTPDLIPVPSSLDVVLAIILVAVVAFSGETIFRGYLLLRLATIMGSPLTAAFLSPAIFSLGHGYEGTAGVVTVGVVGAALALVYLWRRSLVAPGVMHFLLDLVAIVVAPLLR
jgi:uncharacterized protein